jgi:hypothetical protein
MDTEEFSLLLVFSSLIFITNVASAFYKEYYIYSLLFLCLTITSVIFHYNTTIYTIVLDKIFVFSIVFYGGYLFYTKITPENQAQSAMIVTTFLLCIFLYYYGYCTNDYCYHPDKCVGDIYHGMLHSIASFGHHLITFL